MRVATTAMTALEADDEHIHRARIKWGLSRIDVLNVTSEIADQAAALLRTHRLRGHKYATDAVLAVIARTAPPPSPSSPPPPKT